MDHDAFDARLAGSVLQPFISDYCAHLRRGRYAASTVPVYLRCVAHFGHWLRAEKIALSAVNETTGRCFLTGHLARCDCPPRSDGWCTSTGPRSPTCFGSSRRRA